MDHAQVIEKAAELGCKIERRTKHVALITPDGEEIVTASTPSDWRAGRNLAALLRRKGVDVKLARTHGPVLKRSADNFYCREKRCGNLVCKRNVLALDPMSGLGASTIDYADFRSKSCGYAPLHGCGTVLWHTDKLVGRLPRLCALGSVHDGDCAPMKAEPAPVAEAAQPPLPKAEVERRITVAAEAVRVFQDSGKRPVGRPRNEEKISDEQKREAVALVMSGETANAVARAYGVFGSTISEWAKDPRFGGDPSILYGATDDVKREIVKAVLAGMTVRAAAEKWKHDRIAIARWVKDPALGGDPYLNLKSHSHAGGRKAAEQPVEAEPPAHVEFVNARGHTFRTPEFKREVVARILAGELEVHVAADVGIPRSSVRGWLRDPEFGGDPDYDGIALRRARGWHPPGGPKKDSTHAGRRKRSSDDVKKEAVARALAGEYAEDVARDLGCATSSITQWKGDPRYGGDSSNVPLRASRHGYSIERKREIAARALAGEGIRALAEEVGCGVSAVSLWARDTRYGGDPAFDGNRRFQDRLDAGTKAESQIPLPMEPIGTPRPKQTSKLKFCVYCGGDIKAMPADMKFCPHCGHSMKKVV